jgi:hypothetical protein
MHPLTTIIVESACTIANTIKARALFVYADVIQDYPIPSGMLGGTDIILVTQAGSVTEPSAEVTSILQLPPIPLTRMAQIKLAVVMGLSEGYVSAGDKIVCLTGIPALGTPDCIVVLDIGKERELLISTHVPHIAQHIPSAVFEAVLNLAVELASQGREGKPVGRSLSWVTTKRSCNFPARLSSIHSMAILRRNAISSTLSCERPSKNSPPSTGRLCCVMMVLFYALDVI